MSHDLLAPLFAAGPVLPDAARRAMLARGPAMAHLLVGVVNDRRYDADDAPGFGYARAHAAVLLGELDETRAIAAITRALIDTNRLPVAKACLNTLARFGPDAVEELLQHEGTPGLRARRVLVTLICSGVKDPRILAWLGTTIQSDPWFGSLLAETYDDPAALPALEEALDKLLQATTVGHRRIGAIEVLRKAILSLGGEVDPYHGAVMERIAHDIRDGRLRPADSAAPRPLWPELGLSQAGR